MGKLLVSFFLLLVLSIFNFDASAEAVPRAHNQMALGALTLTNTAR